MKATTTITANLTPQSVAILALLHAKQYAAVERAMGKPITQCPPGPWSPTWQRYAEHVVPGLALADFSSLPSSVTSVPPVKGPAGRLARRIAAVAPLPDTGRAPQAKADGRPSRAERYRAFTPGSTLADAIKRGATPRDIRWVLESALVTLEVVS